MSLKKFKWENLLGGGLILFLMAGYAFYTSLGQVFDSFRQEEWIKTQATVTQASTSTSRSGERSNTVYHFEYVYVVNDQEYASDRYSLRFASGDQSSGVDRFSEGEIIEIYYDPADPASAIVELGGAGIFVYCFAGFGVILALMGIGLSFGGDIGVLFYNLQAWIVKIKGQQ